MDCRWPKGLEPALAEFPRNSTTQTSLAQGRSRLASNPSLGNHGSSHGCHPSQKGGLEEPAQEAMFQDQNPSSVNYPGA